ncbi:MAG: aryl-sulfate sulfotransferase [Ignavibacteriae bacterium]|nr:aryl-sulfate sulfotransferase [Ignavibacteriota bacterium]
MGNCYKAYVLLPLLLLSCGEDDPIMASLPPTPTVDVVGKASYPFAVGYVGATDSGNFAAVVYNTDGTPRDVFAFGNRVLDFQLQPTGNYTAFQVEAERIGYFLEFSSSGKVVQRHESVTTSETGVHELRLYPDGSSLLYGILHPVVDMTAFNGLDAVEIQHCIVEYRRPDGSLFTWSTADGMDYADSYNHYQGSPADPYHLNAIDRDSDGNLLLSLRNASQVVKVNSQTGEIVWRLGGKRSDFTFVDDPLNGFARQHGIRRLTNGNVILFDNGNEHTPPASRAVEYALDESAMTARLVWEFRDTTFAFAMGFADRLPNGNTLICYGTSQIIREVTPEGEVLFEMRVRSGELPYRAIHVEGN